MDDLDRLYRRLVQNIRARQPEYLHIPFTVQELYEQLVPYRHNRRELAIETNQDYEVAVARLLSGERQYVRSDPALQTALEQELASPTGNPGIFKDHAQTQLSLSQEEETPTPAISQAVQTAYDALAPSAAVPATMPPPSTTLLSSLSHIDVPIGCRFCGGTLPDDRAVNYCPHCGENLKTQRCPACGAEMDTAWKFCVTCGRRTS